MPALVAGSWVHGNLATWIGSRKNRAWDLLCTAKQSFDLVAVSGRLNAQELADATSNSADCEASDWFWWSVITIPARQCWLDRLYRQKLANFYRPKLPVPAELDVPVSQGGGQAELGRAMRRAS
jgi:alpha-amylase/alpha-mannosidase (GH57 family)